MERSMGTELWGRQQAARLPTCRRSGRRPSPSSCEPVARTLSASKDSPLTPPPSEGWAQGLGGGEAELGASCLAGRVQQSPCASKCREQGRPARGTRPAVAPSWAFHVPSGEAALLWPLQARPSAAQDQLHPDRTVGTPLPGFIHRKLLQVRPWVLSVHGEAASSIGPQEAQRREPRPSSLASREPASPRHWPHHRGWAASLGSTSSTPVHSEGTLTLRFATSG